jgi:hypothetical protein
LLDWRTGCLTGSDPDGSRFAFSLPRAERHRPLLMIQVFHPFEPSFELSPDAIARAGEETQAR